MKTYEKPQLLALTIGGSDMLCAGCTVTTKDNWYYGVIAGAVGNGDSILEPSDFEKYRTAFTMNESCESIELPFVGDLWNVLGDVCVTTAADQGKRTIFVS